MCSPADYWSIVLFTAMVCSALVGAPLQFSFVSRLERQFPSPWAELGKRKVWTDDGNISYAAAQLFLLKGEHTSLPDPALVKLGSRARWSFFLTVALFIAWCPLVIKANAFLPRFSCLSALWS